MTEGAKKWNQYFEFFNKYWYENVFRKIAEQFSINPIEKLGPIYLYAQGRGKGG